MARAMDSRPELSLDTDVLVVGGGAAGVAAAVAAAENNAKVLLIESYGFCGGAAVAGLSGTICGLYYATENPNKPPEQLVFGFADRFISLLKRRNGVTEPVRYGKTWTHVHDPHIWREAADHVLAEAKVMVLFHTLVIDVLGESGMVEGVVAWTKQGRARIKAKIVIDASGDANVAALAGYDTFVGQDGIVQNPTMMFRLLGVDVGRFQARFGRDSIMDSGVARLIQSLNAEGSYRLPRSKIFLFPTPRPHELLCNCTRIIGGDGRELNPLRAEDITEAEIEGRQQAREYARFIRDHLEGCEQAYLNDTGVQIGIRQSRQIAGVERLGNLDVANGIKREDSVARSAWPIELHSGDTPRLSWLLDDYYDVPFGCFVPQKGEGMLVAGRCLSADQEAMASARVTAQCFSYGAAVGFAASLAVHQRCNPRDISATDLRPILSRT